MHDASKLDYLLPPEECKLVYTVFDGVPDLDPCGHPDQYLDAHEVFYGGDPSEDGMLADWKKQKVFLNPPHGEKTPKTAPNYKWYPFSRWMMKASVAAQRGATILALLPANTDRKWFHTYITQCQAIAFLKSRIKNYTPDYHSVNNGKPVQAAQPRDGHMYALWTRDKDVFERFDLALDKRGFVVEAQGLDYLK